MSETFTQLRFLMFLILIFGFTVGVVSQKRITKFIAAMIFMPMLLGLVWYYIRYFRANLPPMESLLFTTGILVVGLVLVFRFLLGKGLWHDLAGHFIYDVLKWIVSLPFRLLRGLINLILRQR